jgi:predicted nucleic acid-binding protein
MSLPQAFWDSSALIPLCVQQLQTMKTEALFANYGVTVWWSTQVEIVSGLTRLLRMREIDGTEFADGKQVAQAMAMTWIAIKPSANIEREARALLEQYPLRAADALQLAAALEWCEGKPKGEIFLSFDKRLSEAAGLAGFTLE